MSKKRIQTVTNPPSTRLDRPAGGSVTHVETDDDGRLPAHHVHDKLVPFFSTYHAGKGAYARVVGKIPESVLLQYATRVEIPDLPALAHAEGRRFTQRVVGGEEP